jgi:hypothetical protein
MLSVIEPESSGSRHQRSLHGKAYLETLNPNPTTV